MSKVQAPRKPQAPLDGNFRTHHGRLVRLHLDRIDMLDQHITAMTAMIDTLVVERDLAWVVSYSPPFPGSAPPART